MFVVLGSTNPVKVAAVERALGAEVAAESVDSGVPDQPRGVAETVAGARNRADRALAGRDADLGVGIEAGVAEPPGTDDLFLITWAAVTDGDRRSTGAGPSIPLPEPIAADLRAGRELGPVMDERLDRDGVKRAEGAVGVLTGGATDRERALAGAVAAAAGPFLTDQY